MNCWNISRLTFYIGVNNTDAISKAESTERSVLSMTDLKLGIDEVSLHLLEKNVSVDVYYTFPVHTLQNDGEDSIAGSICKLVLVDDYIRTLSSYLE